MFSNSGYKKALLLVILVSTAFIYGAKAQGDNAVKLSLLNLAIGTVSVSYEHFLTEKSMIEITAAYTYYNDNGTLYNGFAVTPEYRFLIMDEESANNTFFAPFVRYQHFQLQEDYNVQQIGQFNQVSGSASAQTNVAGLGICFGRQWLIWDKYLIEGFAGPVYNKAFIIQNTYGTQNSILPSSRIDGISLRLGINIGFSF